MKSILHQLKKYQEVPITQPNNTEKPITALEQTNIDKLLLRRQAFIKKLQLVPPASDIIKSLDQATYTDVLYPFEMYWAYTLQLDISALTAYPCSLESYCDEVLKNFIAVHRYHPQTKNPDYDKLLGEALIGSEVASKIFAARVLIAVTTPGRSNDINILPPHVAPVMREALGNPSDPYAAFGEPY